jgi:DNA-binding MurR/RpiR family transcriptional regulator
LDLSEATMVRFARTIGFDNYPSMRSALQEKFRNLATHSARHVIPLRTSGREMLEPLLLMNKDDLLIAIGFFNMTPSLRLVLEHANQHKTPVILVTDTLGPLVGDKATVTLAARRGPVSSFHSLTIPMTIINALLLALSSVDQETVMTNLDRLDQLRDRLMKINGKNT